MIVWEMHMAHTLERRNGVPKEAVGASVQKKKGGKAQNEQGNRSGVLRALVFTVDELQLFEEAENGGGGEGEMREASSTLDSSAKWTERATKVSPTVNSA